MAVENLETGIMNYLLNFVILGKVWYNISFIDGILSKWVYIILEFLIYN